MQCLHRVDWTHLASLSLAHTFTSSAEARAPHMGAIDSSGSSRGKEAGPQRPGLPRLPSHCSEKHSRPSIFFSYYLFQMLKNFFIFFFNLSIADAQCYLSFRCPAEWFSHSVLCCARHKWGSCLSPCNAVPVPSSMFPRLCLSSPWLLHSITGSLYLPVPFTHFAALSTPSPLATTRMFSVFIGLILLFSWKNFYFKKSLVKKQNCLECF